MSDTDQPPVGVPTPPTEPPVVDVPPMVIRNNPWQPLGPPPATSDVVIPDPPTPPPADEVAIPPVLPSSKKE
jgi:hypothetical protein